MNTCEINKVNTLLKNQRGATVLFDDDETTAEVVAYFRKKHYKVEQLTSYGLYYISKRWWQK